MNKFKITDFVLSQWFAVDADYALGSLRSVDVSRLLMSSRKILPPSSWSKCRGWVTVHVYIGSGQRDPWEGEVGALVVSLGQWEQWIGNVIKTALLWPQSAPKSISNWCTQMVTHPMNECIDWLLHSTGLRNHLCCGSRGVEGGRGIPTGEVYVATGMDESNAESGVSQKGGGPTRGVVRWLEVILSIHLGNSHPRVCWTKTYIYTHTHEYWLFPCSQFPRPYNT